MPQTANYGSQSLRNEEFISLESITKNWDLNWDDNAAAQMWIT